MAVLEAAEVYYQLFGCHGVVLGAKSRLLHKTVKVSVVVPGLHHPVHLRLRTTDVATFRQVFVTAEYDCKLRKLPQIIIDAGANIGLTSVFYANKYPDARILALEPEASNFQMLKANVAHYRNITPIRAALWKTRGDVKVIDPGLGHYGFQTISQADDNSDSTKETSVPAVTIDGLIREFSLAHVDILKCDIEGSEREVFETATSWVNRVGVIVIELHEHLRIGCTRSVYSAVGEFGVQWRRGETVFFAKNEYAATQAPRRSVMAVKEATSRLRNRPVFEIRQDP